MSAIVVNGESWPVLLVSWNAPQSDADIERYIATSNAYLEREEPFVLISFMRHYQNDGKHRARLAAWMKETNDKARRLCVASAMVADSMAFRFTLSTLLLLKPFPFPYQVSATAAEAERFVRAKAAERGLALPPRIRYDLVEPRRT